MIVNRQSAQFADGAQAAMPLVSGQGGKEALRADLVPFTMGSDHQVYAEGSFKIPSIYMNDWPDRFIHTNLDVAANIDATKLKRAAFIAAASGWFLANIEQSDLPALTNVIQQRSLQRMSDAYSKRTQVDSQEQQNISRQALRFEEAVVDSVASFVATDGPYRERHATHLKALATMLGVVNEPMERNSEDVVYHRNPAIIGPMSVFGYDYFSAHYPPDKPAPGLLKYQGLWGSGGEYAYEVLNLVDGVRTVRDIRDAVSAIYGPVSEQLVEQYLSALASIDVTYLQESAL